MSRAPRMYRPEVSRPVPAGAVRGPRHLPGQQPPGGVRLSPAPGGQPLHSMYTTIETTPQYIWPVVKIDLFLLYPAAVVAL